MNQTATPLQPVNVNQGDIVELRFIDGRPTLLVNGAAVPIKEDLRITNWGDDERSR